jgi:hypothetical protein
VLDFVRNAKYNQTLPRVKPAAKYRHVKAYKIQRRTFFLIVNLLSIFACYWWYCPIPVVERSKARVCRRSLPGIAGLKPSEGMDVVCCECWVLSGRSPCVGPVTHPEGSYRLWGVMRDLETSMMRRPWPALGCCAKEEEKELLISDLAMERYHSVSSNKHLER